MTFGIAAIQATPVFLDKKATLDKACELVAEAGKKGARLAVFPEAFVPGYPVWVWSAPPEDFETTRGMYGELVEQAVSVKDDLADLCRAARLAKVCVAIGVNERNVEASGTSIYNGLVFIDDQGQIVGKRRKLVPTGPERIVWAQGDGSTFEVWDTPVGKVGGLICWENYMPLARFAMYAWGIRILLAPTWDKGEVWHASLRHIAKEGRVLVVGCAMALRKSDVPDRFAFKAKHMADAPEWLHPGESAIVSPDGKVLAGPVREKEEILIAQIAEDDLSASRWNLDVAGHYGRPDVFDLTVRTDARPMVRVEATPPDRG